MPKSESYRVSECCGGKDCDFLDEKAEQPCWGQVELTSACDDEDGMPIPNHLCQGHRDRYERWYSPELPDYQPEPTTPIP